MPATIVFIYLDWKWL